MWPVKDSTLITTPFGTRCCGNTGRPHYWSNHIHKGVDVGGAVGLDVRAVWGGKVIRANWGPSFGNHIVIDTDRLPDGSPGFWVMYAHLSKKRVPIGARVEAGDVIGELGKSGRVTGPHLHLEVQTGPSWRPKNFVDPQKWLDAHPYWRDKKVYESVMKLGVEDSDSVRNIQSALNDHGFYRSITGRYGYSTRNTVKEFQKANNLPDTGMVDESTAKKLKLRWVPSADIPESTSLGKYLSELGYDVDDNAPYGRPYTAQWHGVQYIVLHHTASPDTTKESDLANYIRSGGKYPPNAQLMLGKSGKVWICSKERSRQSEPGRATHAGKGKGYGVPDDMMNAYSIGLEVQADGTKPLRSYPFYDHMIKLLADLARRYDLDSSKVIGHKEWSTSGKIDPLDNMDVVRLDVALELGENIEPEDDMYIYEYTGKPSGSQKLGTRYTKIDDAKWTPTKNGFLTAMLYVNVSFKLKDGRETGTVRVRAVRGPHDGKDEDATAYQDFTVSKNGTVDGTFLITHTWFELCEADRKIHWEVDTSSDFEWIKANTRYSKWALIPKN